MGSVSKELFKGSVLRSITLMANILIGFLMLPFMIHSLGDGQYGIWVIVGAIIGFYGLLDVGFGRAITRFIVRAMHGNNKENDINIALSSSIFLFSGVGLLSLIITLIIILAVPSFTDSEVNSSIIQLLIGILGLKVSVLFPLTSFGSVLIAKYRFDVLSYIQLFSLLFRTAFIVVFVSNGYDIVAVAYITVIDAFLAAAATVFLAKKFYPGLRVSSSLVSMKKLREYYDFGKYVYIITIADRVRLSIDDLVVAAFIGVGAVTHYTIVVALIRYFGEFMDGILGVINPVFNKYHKLNQWDNLREIFLVATEISAMLSVLVGGLLIVLGKAFITIWVGEEYTDIYLVLLILSASSIVANAQRPSVAVLYAIAKHKYYAKITSIEAIANITISLVLVQYLGMYGVALGTAIPLLFNNVLLQPLYICKQLNLSLKRYYYNLSKYFFAGACIFLPIYFFVESTQMDSYIKLCVVSSIVVTLYTLVCTKYLFSDSTIGYISNVVPDRAKFLLRNVR